MKKQNEALYTLYRDGVKVCVFTEKEIGRIYKKFTGPYGFKGYEIKANASLPQQTGKGS